MKVMLIAGIVMLVAAVSIGTTVVKAAGFAYYVDINGNDSNDGMS